jgi:hypothetical protein
MILVPLFEPEVRNRACSTMCANFGVRGTRWDWRGHRARRAAS